MARRDHVPGVLRNTPPQIHKRLVDFLPLGTLLQLVVNLHELRNEPPGGG